MVPTCSNRLRCVAGCPGTWRTGCRAGRFDHRCCAGDIGRRRLQSASPKPAAPAERVADRPRGTVAAARAVEDRAPARQARARARPHHGVGGRTRGRDGGSRPRCQNDSTARPLARDRRVPAGGLAMPVLPTVRLQHRCADLFKLTAPLGAACRAPYSRHGETAHPTRVPIGL